MFQTQFRQRLRSRQVPLLGTLITLPCADIADVLSQLSFDWLWLDLEHGNLNFHDAQLLLQAIGNRCATIVRVPNQEEVSFKKTLDLGVDGVIVPQVKTAAEAQKIVDYCLYPPQGIRGAGIARAQGYGMELKPYIQQANDQIAIIVQIEHIDAVQAIDSILAIDRLDAVLIGPYDLSGSLGKLGEVQHPDVSEAIQTVLNACQRHHKAAGIFATNAEAAVQWQQLNVNLMAIGTDVTFLWQSAQHALNAVRSKIAQQ